jgi:hypothetical protein
MLSRKIQCIIVIALYSILVPALVTAVNTSVIIQSSGTITIYSANYTITGDEINYVARENGGSGRTTSGTSLSSVMTTVFGWASAGQLVEFIGTFTLSGSVTLAKSIALNLTKATITLSGPSNFQWQVTARVTFYGGHKVDITNPANEFDPPSNGGHIIGTVQDSRILLNTGSDNSIFEGIDFKNSGIMFAYGSGSSPKTMKYVTVQNCVFHDCVGDGSTLSGQPMIGGESGGYHTIQNCRFKDSSTQAIFFDGAATHMTFYRCEFKNISYSGSAHSFYLCGDNSGPGYGGYNDISYCIFHDFGEYDGAIQLKCPYNKIHDNTFYNYVGGVAVSVYSQWSGSIANDNDFYNNTFTDCDSAFWIGHGSDSSDPTLRNLIHNNTFTRVSDCVTLQLSNPVAVADDTKIYYNNFINCGRAFYSYAATMVHNTVFAYNYFDASSYSGSQTQLQATVNSMIYQNIIFPPSGTVVIANSNYGLITNSSSYYYVASRS